MDGPLYEQIYNHVLEKIKSGELQSGTRVPSEKELADQFGVSRITSKKALEMLSANRLIERVQGKGSFVADGLPELGEALQAPAKGPQSWKLVGLILPDFADSYGLRLIHGVEERCSELGGRMLMKITYDKREEEEAAIRSFLQLGVDGFIIFPVHGEHYNSELLRLVLDKHPLVFVDRYLKGLAACSVYTDNRAAAYDITKYLLDRGHSQIGFISLPIENTSTIEDRIQGYTDALIQHGQRLNPQHLMTNLYSSIPRSFEERNVQVDFENVKKFVELNPELSSFVVVEYNLALILREVLLSMGKDIPGECSIVCFDSPRNPFNKFLFTHVSQDEFAMGQRAVELLQQQWESKGVPFNNTVPYTIIKGDSTN
ncbi:GntR family transcriptional regulator [Cohnella lupini]|uniref:DNA-binding LacI/PurR family transcriptional regulator n=1 Tax=Cohnella lupini TaxID=1294267 RepID=A0A3D9HQK1_9BACL|nr:GntR family transcriptional regulator [Cohnella lupini]RED51783.1 DNA-binding LacI/PurR family transcriptional regulator [Cohnella lupini]